MANPATSHVHGAGEIDQQDSRRLNGISAFHPHLGTNRKSSFHRLFDLRMGNKVKARRHAAPNAFTTSGVTRAKFVLTEKLRLEF